MRKNIQFLAGGNLTVEGSQIEPLNINTIRPDDFAEVDVNVINPTQELQGVDLTCSDNRPLTPEVTVGAERQETEATSEIKGIIETPARSVITCTCSDLPTDRASII